MDEIVKLLMEAPDSQLSDGAKTQIRSTWSDPPTRQQVQDTLDYCAYGADASTFAMKVLSALKERCI